MLTATLAASFPAPLAPPSLDAPSAAPTSAATPSAAPPSAALAAAAEHHEDQDFVLVERLLHPRR